MAKNPLTLSRVESDLHLWQSRRARGPHHPDSLGRWERVLESPFAVRPLSQLAVWRVGHAGWGAVMAGRYRKPEPLRALEGYRDKCPPRDEPKPPPATADVAPLHGLSAAERKEWRKVAPLLAQMGVLGTTDLAMLAEWCRAVVECRELRKLIKTDGRTVRRGEYGLVSNPAVTQLDKCLVRFMRLSSELGLSPVGRARMSVKAASKAEQSEGLRERGRAAKAG